MKLHELKIFLAKNPEKTLQFILPDDSLVPAHAHITEAARIDKHFVDCGGTFREEIYCRLQTWVADDMDHKLTAKKLLGILNKADSILLSDELDVDIEHELKYISQFPLRDVEIQGETLMLKLSLRHTACLAPEKCCPPQAELVGLGRKSNCS